MYKGKQARIITYRMYKLKINGFMKKKLHENYGQNRLKMFTR